MTAVIILFLNMLAAGSQTPGTKTILPDTSFTTQSAFLEAQKKYPHIKIPPELKHPKVRENRNLVYCTISNEGTQRELLLDVFYPKKKSKLPRTAILIIHGGGWRSGNRSQHYSLARKLSSLGYVCFTSEYRLSTEAPFPAAVHDLKAAVKWIRNSTSQYNLDPHRITALGFSSGGELAAFLGNTNGKTLYDSLCIQNASSNLNAIIDIDGIVSFVHPESGEGDDSKKISAATAWLGAAKKDNYKLWESASPLTHAGPNSVPTLFVNSSVKRMHAGRGDYISILLKYGIYSEVHEFPDAPHSFVLFDPWINPTVKFIDEFLKRIFPNSNDLQ